MADSLNFREWAQRWMDLAAFEGARVPETRIQSVTDLWRQPIPGTWKRDRDARLLDPATRYSRTHAGGAKVPRGEHRIEHEILEPPPEITPTTCFGARLVDGVNAVPL